MVVRGRQQGRDKLHAAASQALEAVFQLFTVQFPANEHQAAFMLFAIFPWPLVVALDNHMNTLHHIALGIALEGDNALQAQDVRAVGLGDLLNPGKKRSGFISPPRSDIEVTVTS